MATAAEVRDAIGDAQKDGKRAVLIRLKSDNVTSCDSDRRRLIASLAADTRRRE